jgi:autotransporter-associated beta strand protein
MKPRSPSWVLPLVLLLGLLAFYWLQPPADHPPARAALEKHHPAVSAPRTIDTAPLDAFDAWLADDRRSALVAKGVELAQARRIALKALIQIDPQAALERAVPYAVRKRLPEPVVRMLEKPVSTTVDLVVEQACGGRSWRQHWLTLDGRRVQVFTYGERAETMTKEKLSVHGIAIDEVMAMLDDPLRELSAEEVADGGFTGRVAQLGMRMLGIESDAVLEAARRQLRETEETLGPVALPAYRDLALGRMEGMFPLAMQNGEAVSNDEDLPPVAFSAWTEGAKTMLYIRARFANEAPDYVPVTLTNAQTNQGAAQAFWLENSYGKSSLTTTYTDVVTLPKNGSEYIGNFNTLLIDARQAAIAANPAWNHANFGFHTIITNTAVNNQGQGFGYIGIAQLGGPGSHLLRNFISVRTASHEYGHNLGLNHSEYWLTDSPSPIGRDSIPGGYAGDNPDDERIEYGHKFAVMGSQDFSGDFENGRAHYTASDKNRLDWLLQADGDIVSTTTSGTFRLYRHDVPVAQFGNMTPGVARAIKINLNASDPTGLANPYRYWLNYRNLPTDGIAENWLPQGLQVDWRRDGSGFRAVQLDMTPYSSDSGPYGSNPGYAADNADKEDAVLLIGRTFSDTGANIHFTPVAKGGSNPNEWLDVVVNIGTQGSNSAPVISSLAVSNATPGTGQTVNFAVTATDPNGDTLAYHWDMGDNNPQIGQLNNPNQTKSWSTAGYYVVRCEVSDMKGGKTTAYRVISVGSPVNNGTWTNASGGSWATNANWVGNSIAGGEGNTADFSTLNPTSDTTVALDAARAIGNLIFGDTNTSSAATWFLTSGSGGSLLLAGTTPTITVNPLGSGKFANLSALLDGFNGFTKTGTGNLILNNSANTLTGPVIINAGNIQLNSAALTNATSIAIHSGALVVATSGANAIGGTISFGGGNLQFNNLPGTDYSPQFSTAANQPYRISVGSAHEVSFNSNLASPGGTLTKLGTGTLILGAANSYNGGTTLSLGTLRFGNATSLGSGPLSINGNSTLQAGLAATLPNALGISTGITGTVDTNGQNTTLGGAITGAGSLTKTGAGTLTLTGGLGNTLAGGVNVNAGRLDVLDGLSLTNTPGTVTVASGALFNYSKNFTSGNDLSRSLTLSGSGSGGLGALNLRGNATATASITLAADATISHDFNTATISDSITGTDRNLTLTTITTGTPQPGMTVSGPITLGTGGITMQGVANSGNFSIRLSGNNSYTGETRVVSGTLMLSGDARIHDSAAVRIDTGAVLHLDFSGTDTLAALYMGGTAMPTGTYGSPTSTAANKSAFFAGNGILQVGAINNYDSWAATRLPPVTGGPNGDDDNDGVKNLVEYALTDGGERGVLNGNSITFTKRGTPYGGDLVYIIETSETLGSNSWSPAVTHGPAQLGSDMSYTFNRSSPLRQFARLKVVKSP